MTPDEKITADRKRIGAKIKELRKEKKMTQKQVSSATGLSQSSISMIEDGAYSAGYDQLAKIADSLGAKIEILTQS